MSHQEYAWPHVIKGAIFDCDGTVVDTLPLYWKANSEVMGKTFPPEFQPVVNGKGDIDEAQAIIDEFKLDMTPQQFVERRIPKLKVYLPNADLVTGVDTVIRKLADMKIPMGVATSSHREAYTAKISKHLDLFKLFDVSVCGNEVTQAKPAPEIFLKAAERMGLKPENVLVFEDAVYGIQAANAGGFPSVIISISEGDTLNDKLSKSGAVPQLIIDRFADFDFSKFKWQA